MVRERFRAMGTTIELLLDAPDAPEARAAIGRARAEFARLEGLLSRFLPGSELSALNRVRRMRVGADLLRVLDAALGLRRRTGGRFDPTVGRAVRDCGYDRSFESVAAADPRPAPPPAPAAGVVVLDRASAWVMLGPGVDLDLGAIAKGDAADRACALLSAAGPCLVNAGGDVAVSGERPSGGWPVALDGPSGLVLDLGRGALATSGTDRRRWTRAGRGMHHAVHPATGLPAATDLVRATAVAATCAEADALATALLVAGAEEGRRLADAWGVPAALAGADGTLTLAGGLA